MTAKNGLVVSCRKVVGVCLALALVGAALFASSASAKKGPPTPSAFIALGDSISYGYKEETFLRNREANKEACENDELAACEPPSSFEGGFVGDFGEKLAKKEKAHHTLTVTNMACPGETSGGLIGNGPLGSAIEASREAKEEPSLKLSAPCAWENVDGLSLKTPLGGHSELEAAVAALEAGTDVTAVTINIGSNDELGVVADCENATYLKENGFQSGLAGLKECLEVEASPRAHLYPGGLFAHILVNIGVTIGTLRSHGYEGPVVILGFYNPDAVTLPGSDALQEALNGELEKAVGEKAYGSGVAVAPIFAKFNPGPGVYKKVYEKKGNKEAAENAAGKAEAKAICKYTEMCNAYDKEQTGEGDIHPTKAGYEEIAKIVGKAYAALVKEGA